MPVRGARPRSLTTPSSATPQLWMTCPSASLSWSSSPITGKHAACSGAHIRVRRISTRPSCYASDVVPNHNKHIASRDEFTKLPIPDHVPAIGRLPVMAAGDCVPSEWGAVQWPAARPAWGVTRHGACTCTCTHAHTLVAPTLARTRARAAAGPEEGCFWRQIPINLVEVDIPLAVLPVSGRATASG